MSEENQIFYCELSNKKRKEMYGIDNAQEKSEKRI
jgi:hypothetical protein